MNNTVFQVGDRYDIHEVSVSLYGPYVIIVHMAVPMAELCSCAKRALKWGYYMTIKEYFLLIAIGLFCVTVIDRFIVLLLERAFGDKIFYSNFYIMYTIMFLILCTMIFLLSKGILDVTGRNKFYFVILLGLLIGIPFNLHRYK
jgi:hypothetical protein